MTCTSNFEKPLLYLRSRSAQVDLYDSFVVLHFYPYGYGTQMNTNLIGYIFLLIERNVQKTIA